MVHGLTSYLCRMNEKFVQRIQAEISGIRDAGLYKNERVISSRQGAEITVNGKTVLNFCANNYLGLSSHPKTIEAAHKYIDSHGYGMSSVRFICGTQDIHKQLEKKIAGLEARQLVVIRNELLQKDEIINGINFIGDIIEVDNADALKRLCLDLKTNLRDYVAVLCANIGGKPFVAVAVMPVVTLVTQGL